MNIGYPEHNRYERSSGAYDLPLEAVLPPSTRIEASHERQQALAEHQTTQNGQLLHGASQGPAHHPKLVALTSTLPPTTHWPSCSAAANSPHPLLLLRRAAPLLRVHQRSLVVQSRDGAAATARAVYCLQKRCDASQAEEMSRPGHRSALGAGGDVFPVSATAGGLDLVVQGDSRGVCQRRSQRPPRTRVLLSGR